MARRRRGSSDTSPIVWLVLLALPVAAVVAAYFYVDPNRFKPRIAEAALAATGRELALRGPITIALSLTPTLRADDVGLANPPGFSRPELATLGRAEAQLALWPLLQGRIEIIRLVLVHPDVMLETDAAGNGNWHLSPAAVRQASAPGATPAAARTVPSGNVPRFAVGSVRIEGGRVTLRDGRRGVSHVAEIATLEASEMADPQPAISATANMTVEGHAAAVTAELGSFARLVETGAAVDSAPPWPVQMVVRTEGTRLAAAGTIVRPLEGRGYALTLEASAPDLAPIGTLLGMPLPALHDVSATAKVSDASGAPVFTALAGRAGSTDLRTVRPGAMLGRLELTAPAIDQPVHAEAEGSFAETHLHMFGDLGSLASILPTASARIPFPVDVTLEAAGATLSAKGTVGTVKAFSGIDLATALRVPDLAALSRLVGRPLPPLRDLALDARVTDRDGSLLAGVDLTHASLTLPQADFAGDITLGWLPRPSVQGQLASRRVDFDALRAALMATTPQASPALAPPAPADISAPATVPQDARPGRIISDRPFNLEVLKTLDADLRLAIGELRFGEVTARDLSGRAVLTQGRLAIDPISATLPGGKMDGRMTLDASAAEPSVSLMLAAPGLALKPMLTALGLPDDVTGTVDVSADLSGVGGNPRSLAASLSGRIALVMTDGELDNRLLARLGEKLRVARLPVGLLTAAPLGRTRVRCMVARADLSHGAGTLAPLVLDTSRALVQGTGTINLADETLTLRLRPMIRTGPGIVVPVRVTGTLQQLNVGLDSGGAVEGLATGLLAGLPSALRNPLAALAAERGGDACGPAITAARAVKPVQK